MQKQDGGLFSLKKGIKLLKRTGLNKPSQHKFTYKTLLLLSSSYAH